MTCAYCQTAIEGPPYKPCRQCASPHHLNCWTEHGGCALPGCPGEREAQSGQPATPREQREGSAAHITVSATKPERSGPRAWRRAALAATAAVCLLSAGLAVRPLLDRVTAKDASSRQETTVGDGTNTQYLADLIRKGPFTESLPSPLVPGDLRDVTIADSSSVRKLDAVELEVQMDPARADTSEELQVFGHMETYSTREEAMGRGNASLDDLRRRYGGSVNGTAQSFCINGGTAGDFWTCAGVRDFVYAEVTVSPAPNAYLPIATGTVGAMLRYADRQTRLATT